MTDDDYAADDFDINSFSSLHVNLVTPFTSEWKENALFFPLHLLALHLFQFRKAITNRLGWTGSRHRQPFFIAWLECHLKKCLQLLLGTKFALWRNQIIKTLSVFYRFCIPFLRTSFLAQLSQCIKMFLNSVHVTMLDIFTVSVPCLCRIAQQYWRRYGDLLKRIIRSTRFYL